MYNLCVDVLSDLLANFNNKNYNTNSCVLRYCTTPRSQSIRVLIHNRKQKDENIFIIYTEAFLIFSDSPLLLSYFAAL